jgi:hypothetical protein
MKNKWMLITFGLLALFLMAAAIPSASSFLGNREKGIGIEVTTGGDIKILPKTTVGKTYVSNPMVFSGDMSFTNSTLTLDSSLVFQNAATITNPDSIFVNESAGIVLNGGTRVKGGIKGRSLELNGALVVAGQTTIATTISGLLKAASGVISAAVINVDYPSVAKWNELRNYLADGLLVHGTLLLSAVPEKFKTTSTAVYTLSGVTYTKAATDNLTFSAGHTVNTAGAAGQFYGIILLQINAAGTVSTKVPAADQVYTSSALAIAALPAADALNTALGYILIYTKEATKWAANTDDMTDGSDCATATFSNTVVKALPAAL